MGGKRQIVCNICGQVQRTNRADVCDRCYSRSRYSIRPTRLCRSCGEMRPSRYVDVCERCHMRRHSGTTPRSCRGCGVDLGITNKWFCPSCKLKRPAWKQRRVTNKAPRAERGYGRDYQAARAYLLKDNPPCHWCGAPATTADHEPPIHVVGHPHLNLVPACRKCNCGRNNRDLALRRSQAVVASRLW